MLLTVLIESGSINTTLKELTLTHKELKIKNTNSYYAYFIAVETATRDII